jgi:hypothetical protein
MDLAFDGMYGWLVLGLNRVRGHFLFFWCYIDFITQKGISRGYCEFALA